jgi:cytochrome b involved in lipid metabolism
VPGRPGQGVTVAELLNRKEGSEVWVVINGDVYE